MSMLFFKVSSTLKFKHVDRLQTLFLRIEGIKNIDTYSFRRHELIKRNCDKRDEKKNLLDDLSIYFKVICISIQVFIDNERLEILYA